MSQNLDRNSPKVRSLLLEKTLDSKHPLIPLETSFSSTPQPAYSSEHQTSTVPSDSLDNYQIDLESMDADVALLRSTRGFPKVINRCRRKQPVTVILDEDSEDTNTTQSVEKAFRSSLNTPNKRNRSLTVRTVMNNDLRPHLEEHNEKQKNVLKSGLESEKVALKEHPFTCVVCTNPLLQPSSTICGHIFCLRCIKAFIQERKKCPICAKKLTKNDFHRVYLPVSEY